MGGQIGENRNILLYLLQIMRFRRFRFFLVFGRQNDLRNHENPVFLALRGGFFEIFPDLGTSFFGTFFCSASGWQKIRKNPAFWRHGRRQSRVFAGFSRFLCSPECRRRVREASSRSLARYLAVFSRIQPEFDNAMHTLGGVRRICAFQAANGYTKIAFSLRFYSDCLRGASPPHPMDTGH